MAEIAMVVKLTAAEGKLDELLEAAAKLVAATEDEPGTLQYALHTDAADPSAVWFYERYADQTALDAHAGSTAMADAMRAFGGLLGGPPEMHMLSIAQAKGGAG
jgi:quinol monooxygenase YgiN